MKEFKWYEWVMLVVLALMASVGFILSPWGQALISSEAAPAWIQAVGSVGAIGAAIWISRSQYNQDRALERKRERDSLGAALVLAERSLDLVDECLTTDAYEYFEADEFLYDSREFEQVATALRSVPVHEFPPSVVLAIMSAAQSATQAMRAVEGVRNEQDIEEWERPAATEWLESIRDRLADAVATIRGEVELSAAD